MKIFITGGTGAVGRPLIELLEKENHKLLILSRKSPKKTGNNTNYIKGDLKRIKLIKARLKKFRPEFVIHLAWENLRDFSINQGVANLISSLDLMFVLAEIGCKKILVTGTCWEYGKVTGKIKEDLIITKPFNSYALAKDCFRRLAEVIAEKNKIQFIWARLFFVYGPGQNKSSLIPYLISSGKTGMIPNIKTPESENDFVYVYDVAEAITKLIKKVKKSGIYNIGSGKPTQVGKIVKLIHPSYTFKSKNKKRGLYADISKIKRETGWQSKTNINEGIKKTISYFNNEKK
jgi:UDP-glucose 4-epimerase